jgi:hypothetical protein
MASTLSFGALPAPALARIVAFVQEAAADSAEDLTSLALTERATLAAVLDATLLRIDPGPALLPWPWPRAGQGHGGGYVPTCFDLRDTDALEERMRDFLGACVALQTWLSPRRAAPSVALGPSARAARGLPRAPALPPGAFRAAVVRVAVGAAAAAGFHGRIMHLLAHSNWEQWIRFHYAYRKSDFDAWCSSEFASDEPYDDGDATMEKPDVHWHEYWHGCSSPRNEWVKETYVRTLWGPSRQRRCARALRLMLRAAGGAANLLRTADKAACAQRSLDGAAEAARLEAWSHEACGAAHVLTEVRGVLNNHFPPERIERRVDGSRCSNHHTDATPRFWCTTPDAGAPQTLRAMGEMMRLCYATTARTDEPSSPSSPPPLPFRHFALRRLVNEHVSPTLLRALADGMACPCALCDAVQAAACAELAALALAGGPALLCHVAWPPSAPCEQELRWPHPFRSWGSNAERDDGDWAALGALGAIATACWEHPMKRALRREGARALGLMGLALLRLHDAQQEQAAAAAAAAVARNEGE